jgi:6-phosphogluconolactonase (cycloisomerase 2 family)
MLRKLSYLVAALLLLGACDDDDDQIRPAVFTMTNAAQNAVVVHTRNDDGSLLQGRTFFTQGAGTGAPLGSQGSLVLTSDRRFLLAANAGSNEITVFRLRGTGLDFVQKIASGGTTPVSIAQRGGIVYVLNAGGAGNITGFQIATNGVLSPLGVTQALSGAPAPAPGAIAFSNDGTRLVVTEKGTNRIDVFPVDANGLAGQPIVQPSSGLTPFGLTFASQQSPASGALLVAEAFSPGGTATLNGGAVSSYALGPSGQLTTISASVKTQQTATCWIVATDNGFVYTSNTDSNSITGFRLAGNGTLSLLNANGITANSGGAAPADLAFSSSQDFLYALNAGSGQISAFRVEANGNLSLLGTFGDQPPNSAGLAAF